MPSRRMISWVALGGLVFAVHAAVALLVRDHGWDDGSITLAFSRTFANSHRIALTPGSDTVEGFSSPFWFVLLAVTYKLFAPGFFAFITLSQLWAAAFSAVAAMLAHRLVEPRLGALWAWVACAAVFVAAPFVNETMNGMEMSALAALAIGLALLVERRPDRFSAAVFVLALLGPAVRLEAAGYLVGGALGLVLLSRYVGAAAAIVAGAVTSVAALTAVRLAVFGYWLPNTIRAKQWPPYSPRSPADRLHSSWLVLLHSVELLAPALVFVLAAGVAGRIKAGRRSPGVVSLLREQQVSPGAGYAAGYLLAVIGFNLLIGENWGYPGRMELSAAALALPLATGMVAGRGGVAIPLATCVLAVAVALTSTVTLQTGNIRDAMAHPRRAGDSAAITPARYRTTGLAADQVRRALARPTLEYLTADVGGSSLCCPRLEVRDAALLANPTLAAKGYADFGVYLRRTAPDIIELHRPWSALARIEGVPFFDSHYAPVVVHRTLFYLRRDGFRALASRCEYLPVARARHLRYGVAPHDLRFLRRHFPQGLCRLDLGRHRSG